QIRVVNHFPDSLHSIVLNSESAYQRFKRAFVSLMREIPIQYVERSYAPAGQAFGPENEFRLRIYERANEPRRTDAIDFRAWSSHQCPAADISLIYLFLRLRARLSSLKFSQKHFNVLSLRAMEEVALPDFTELFSKAVELFLKA